MSIEKLHKNVSTCGLTLYIKWYIIKLTFPMAYVFGGKRLGIGNVYF